MTASKCSTNRRMVFPRWRSEIHCSGRGGVGACGDRLSGWGTGFGGR